LAAFQQLDLQVDILQEELNQKVAQGELEAQ